MTRGTGEAVPAVPAVSRLTKTVVLHRQATRALWRRSRKHSLGERCGALSEAQSSL